MDSKIQQAQLWAIEGSLEADVSTFNHKYFRMPFLAAVVLKRVVYINKTNTNETLQTPMWLKLVLILTFWSE